MVEAFWEFVNFLVRVAFTIFCLAATVYMWKYGGAPTSQDMWVAFGAIHAMLVVFVIMVWRYGR